MAWIEPVSTAVTAASLANELAKSSSSIKKYYKRIITRLRYGSVLLPIFGAGGVGKSTAGKILVGGDPLNVGNPYDESWTVEPQNLDGDIPGQILVAPGQPKRAKRYWPDLIAKANEGKASGIVNVVCYGLHSFEIKNLADHDFWQDGMAVKDFMVIYSADRREEELRMLDLLLNALAPAKRDFYFLTLVTKQDLWWYEKKAVEKYYMQGPYNEKVERFGSKVGIHRFHHEYLPTSLTIANLCGPSGEIVEGTSPGYDHAIHLRYLQSFFGKLNDLIEKHLKAK